MALSQQEDSAPNKAHRDETYNLQDTAFQRLMVERTGHGDAAFILPFLKSGMNLLDCGCGPGSMTIDLAQIVAPGHVTGIDISDTDIKRATALAQERGVSNVRFERASVYTLPFDEHTFDAVFSNALLEHLAEPVDALREMRRVLKRGGVAGIRAADRDGYLFAPTEPFIERYAELVDQLRAENATAHIGKHLRSLLRQAGFARIIASASYEHYGTPEKVQKLGEALARSILEGKRAEELIHRALSDRAELDEIAAALRGWAVNPDAFFALARCEAIGWTE